MQFSTICESVWSHPCKSQLLAFLYFLRLLQQTHWLIIRAHYQERKKELPS